MTEYDEIFINDQLFRIEQSVKSIENALYEIENFTDEFDSDNIKNNMNVMIGLLNNIKLELTRQGE